MESNADRESYWTLIEAATWIRTRNLNQVLGIDERIKSPISAAESKQALGELPERCRNGSVRSVGRRCIYYDSRFKRAEPAGTSFLWRRLPEGAPSDVTEGIAPHEWTDLEWEPAVDGKLTGNLRSRLLSRRAWMLVQFSRSDAMREWPSHVSSDYIRPPGKIQLRRADNRRGRKPIKRERVMEAMKRDLSQGADLQGMREKELAAKYGVSRVTARKARDAVVPKIVDK